MSTFLKSRLKTTYTAAPDSVDRDLALGGILVIASIIASLCCIVAFVMFDPAIGLRLMATEALLLFIVVWARIHQATDKTAPHD